jgi:hypothetical protein
MAWAWRMRAARDLALGQVVGVHDAAGLVALAGGTHEQFAPPVKGAVETRRTARLGDVLLSGVGSVEPRRGFGGEFSLQERVPADAFVATG